MRVCRLPVIAAALLQHHIRCHVERGADDRLGLRLEAREAEVCDLRFVGCQKNVLELQISVAELDRVAVLHRLDQVLKYFRAYSSGNSPFCSS